MKTQDAIDYYGNQVELAKALGVTKQAITQWKETGILPIGRAYQMQVVTGGDMEVDPNQYENHE